MCGRMNVEEEVDDAFEALVGHPFPGEGNVNTAPTEPVWIVRNRSSKLGGGLEAAQASWWLTPYWCKTRKPKYATFNAKSETLAKSSTFREPFARRRCVVPITGFYEWRKAGGVRRPYFVRPQAGPMLLAGVWDRWRSRPAQSGEEIEVIESFAVVTTAVRPELSFIHNRQPAMLSPQSARLWLNREAAQGELQALLAPRIPYDLAAVPVSNYVGDPRNKERRCATPVGDAVLIAGDV